MYPPYSRNSFSDEITIMMSLCDPSDRHVTHAIMSLSLSLEYALTSPRCSPGETKYKCHLTNIHDRNNQSGINIRPNYTL